MVSRLLLLSSFLLLCIAITVEGHSQTSTSNRDVLSYASYKESALVGKNAQTLTQIYPNHKVKNEFRLVHLRFAYSEVIDVLCKRTVDVATKSSNTDSRRKLCSIACGSHVPSFLANLAMDTLHNASNCEEGAELVTGQKWPPPTLSAHNLEVSLTRGRWNWDQWGSAAAADMKPIGHVQPADCGSRSPMLGLHVPAGATILIDSFQQVHRKSRGGSNERVSQAEARVRAMHAKLSAALCAPTPPLPVFEAEPIHISDHGTSTGLLYLQRQPLRRVSVNSGVDSDETELGKQPQSKSRGGEWYSMHNPAASLTGICFGSWLHTLLPVPIRKPAPSHQSISSNLLRGRKDAGKEKKKKARPADRTPLASMLRTEMVAQAVSLAPWVSLHLQLSIHVDNRTSASRAPQLGKAYRVDAEVAVTLLLHPTRVKAHEKLLRALQTHETIHNASDSVSVKSASPGGNVAPESTQQQPAAVDSGADTSVHAPSPEIRAACVFTCNELPVVHIHRTVRSVQTGYVMTQLFVQVGDEPASPASAECSAPNACHACTTGAQGESLVASREVLVTVTEPIPSFTLPLLHTYRLSKLTHAIADANTAFRVPPDLVLSQTDIASPPNADAILIATLPSFAASASRLRWTQPLELNTSYTIQMLHKVLPLSRERHAADASRGRDYPPAYVSLHMHHCSCAWGPCSVGSRGQTGDVLLMVSSNLVRVPIPDFSMPFNVLTLGATATAFLLGSLINALFDPSKQAECVPSK